MTNDNTKFLLNTDRIARIRTYESSQPKTGQDADTLLADILENMEIEITGQAEELFGIYEQSDDKASFEKLFEAITGTAFDMYLDAVIQHYESQTNA